MLSVFGLTCNGMREPRGLEGRLGLSWRLGLASGAKQVACRVMVTSPYTGRMRWDSGRIKTDVQRLAYGGEDLDPGELCVWFVTVWDSQGAEAHSVPATFSVGMPRESWKASWVAPIHAPSNVLDENAVVYGQDFRLGRGRKVACATVYACARGTYSMMLDGVPLTPGPASGLVPGQEALRVRTIDVTERLWDAPDDEMCHRFEMEVVGGDKSVLAQLDVRYEDGDTCTLVASDASWECRMEEVQISHALRGEVCDFARSGEATPVATLEPRDLTCAYEPPFVELPPPSFALTRDADGWVLRMDERVVGSVGLSGLPLTRGQRVTLTYDDGSQDIYVAAEDGPVTWRPRLTVHGLSGMGECREGFGRVVVEGVQNPQPEWFRVSRLAIDGECTRLATTSDDALNMRLDKAAADEQLAQMRTRLNMPGSKAPSPIADDLWHVALGIKWEDERHSDLRIEPDKLRRLEFARISILAPSGLVTISWRREGSDGRLEVRLPAWLRAEVEAPRLHEAVVGAGRYAWHVPEG